MAAKNTPAEKPAAKPKRPTANDQIAELREQISALTQAMASQANKATAVGNGQSAVVEPVAAPNDQGPMTTDARHPVSGLFKYLFIAVSILAVAGFSVHTLLPTSHSRLPSHTAVVNFAHLLATDVCDELLAEVQKAEDSGETYTSEAAGKLIKDRAEDAGIAAFEPVLKSLNDAQNEDGVIVPDQARKIVSKIRQGLESVR